MRIVCAGPSAPGHGLQAGALPEQVGVGRIQLRREQRPLTGALHVTTRQGDDGKRLPHKERGRAKKRLVGERALADLDAWLTGPSALAAE